MNRFYCKCERTSALTRTYGHCLTIEWQIMYAQVTWYRQNYISLYASMDCCLTHLSLLTNLCVHASKNNLENCCLRRSIICEICDFCLLLIVFFSETNVFLHVVTSLLQCFVSTLKTISDRQYQNLNLWFKRNNKCIHSTFKTFNDAITWITWRHLDFLTSSSN